MMLQTLTTQSIHPLRRWLKARRTYVLRCALIIGLLLPSIGQMTLVQVASAQATADDAISRTIGFAQINSVVAGDTITFDWTTSYEVGNIGFNILAETEDGIVQVNDDLIPSGALGHLEPQHYAFTATVDATAFSIQSIDGEGELSEVGPYAVGTVWGDAPSTEEVDWAAVRADQSEQEVARETDRVNQVNAALASIAGPAPDADEPLVEQSAGILADYTTYLPMLSGAADRNATDMVAAEVAADNAAQLAAGARIELLVKQDGIYRVTYEDLLAANFDLTGVTSAYLALTNQDVPVRMRVVPARAFGPGAYIEFFGEGLDTLYTDTNVYVLRVDRSLAFRTYRNLTSPDTTKTAPTYYVEEYEVEENGGFATTSPTDDPWYMSYLLVTNGKAKSTTYTFNGVDHVAADSGVQAQVSVSAWGLIDDDHELAVRVNNVEIAKESFYGRPLHTVTGSIAPAALDRASNTLTWELSMGHGNTRDGLALESYHVSYPRKFVVDDRFITFDGDAGLYRVENMTGGEAVVYSYYRNRLWRMESTIASAGDGTLLFPGWGADATYYVTSTDLLLKPGIRAGRVPVDIDSGQYDYVIISHPNFIDSLAPLVNKRTAEN
ncbi:MAG: hypothetical protein KDD78_19740 [Caldilineaceae bacterium]|nr:hypothetical protein [Caldilineaceae bacterium]